MPDEWLWFVAVVGVVLTVLNIIDKIISLKNSALEPQVKLEERVSDLEKQVKKHDEYFDKDKKRLDDIEHEVKRVNTIVIKSLQALTEHALDGNNNDKLHECAKEMNDYLLDR